MASRKYGIGVTVERKAIETFQKADVMAEFPNSWKTAVVRGTIMTVGIERARLYSPTNHSMEGRTWNEVNRLERSGWYKPGYQPNY